MDTTQSDENVLLTNDPLDVVEHVLAAENLPFDRTEDGDLAFSLAGDWKDYELWFAWRPEGDCLQLCLSMDLTVNLNAGVAIPVQFPDFDPVIFQIGPIAIRWYALAYVAGILLGWRYAVGMIRNGRLWAHRAPPMSTEQLDDLILWATLGIIVGGRLGHVLFYTPQLIWRDPMEILMIWRGGMSFHGGALGVLLALAVYGWRNKLDLLRLGDIAAAAAPFGLFFGRIANFINGELWGRPTELPWGVNFCNTHILETYGACPAGDRHPSQLYEAALEGLVLFLILRWATHGAKLTNRRGVVFGLFMAFYGLFRVLLETVREPDAGLENLPLGLTMGMYLSIPMILAGAFLIWRGMREPLPPQRTDEPASP